jgi:peroxiredoxin
MVRWLLLTAAWLAAAAGGAGAAEAERGADNVAPDFVLKSTTGSNLRLSEYRGEVVMIAFWASWCGECRTQLKSFNEIYDAYHDIGFELLAVSLDPDLRDAAETAASLHLEFPVLTDATGDVGELYDVDDMPYVVFVDREGTLRDVVAGYGRTSGDEYKDRLRGLLRE